MFKHLAFQCLYLARWRVQAAPQCLVAALSANAARAWVAGCGNLVLCASQQLCMGSLMRSATPNSSLLTLTPHWHTQRHQEPFKVWSTTAFLEPEVAPMIGGVGYWSSGLLIYLYYYVMWGTVLTLYNDIILSYVWVIIITVLLSLLLLSLYMLYHYDTHTYIYIYYKSYKYIIIWLGNIRTPLTFIYRAGGSLMSGVLQLADSWPSRTKLTSSTSFKSNGNTDCYRYL